MGRFGYYPNFFYLSTPLSEILEDFFNLPRDRRPLRVGCFVHRDEIPRIRMLANSLDGEQLGREGVVAPLSRVEKS